MQNNKVFSDKLGPKLSKPVDLVNIILEDHIALKNLIKVMKDSENEFEQRLEAFSDFVPALIAHAKPEEEILYTYLKSKEELREHGFEGDVEHSLADQLVEECKRTTDKDQLSAKIKVLAELVEHHIEEEEKEILPDYKKHSSIQERAQLADQFLTRKIDYLAAGDDNIIPDAKSERAGKLH
jgi:hemerythrin superfamily protein